MLIERKHAQQGWLRVGSSDDVLCPDCAAKEPEEEQGIPFVLWRWTCRCGAESKNFFPDVEIFAEWVSDGNGSALLNKDNNQQLLNELWDRLKGVPDAPKEIWGWGDIPDRRPGFDGQDFVTMCPEHKDQYLKPEDDVPARIGFECDHPGCRAVYKRLPANKEEMVAWMDQMNESNCGDPDVEQEVARELWTYLDGKKEAA